MYVIVKGADGKTRLVRLKQGETYQPSDGETLVALDSKEGVEFIEAEADRVAFEERSAAAAAKLEQHATLRTTPAGRTTAVRGAIDTTSTSDGGASDNAGGDDAGGRKTITGDARQGLGLETYSKLTDAEARGGTKTFAEFLRRATFDPEYKRERALAARAFDEDLWKKGVKGIGLDFQTKTLAEGTGSAGGYLVPPQYIQEMLELIRPNAAAFQAGVQARVVNSNLVYLPTMSTAAVASWIAENGAITPTDQTFGQQSASLSKLGAGVKVSNELIADSDPAIMEIVQQDLARVIALKLDLGIFEGSGSAPEIRGIANTSGVTAGPAMGANGRTPTLADLSTLTFTLEALNITDYDRWSFVMHPRGINTFRSIMDPNGYAILQANSGVNAPTRSIGPNLYGFPYHLTTQLSIARTVGTNSDTTNVYFGRFYEMFALMSGGLMIDTSQEAADATNSAFWSDQTWIRAKQRVGFLVRRPSGVVVWSGVRP
jgi:HK97 family phage major capsid protein